jgi:hypothetical protein
MATWFDQHDVRTAAEIAIGGVTPELTARVAIFLRDPALSVHERGAYVGTLELDENDLRRALEEIEAASERARRTVVDDSPQRRCGQPLCGRRGAP